MASGFTLIELVIVISIIGILAAISLPSYNKIKSKAKEAEVKAGLHNIQINIERFAVDNDGNYPEYLIGGECSAYVLKYTEDGQINQYLIETERSLNCDPMIRMGYVNVYPRNPFVSMRKSVQLLQGEVGDPLRSAFPDGQETGTRFGANCNVMGQVLCDARWMEWLCFDQKQEKVFPRPTWANIQYPFYDIWYNGRPKPFLSGSFMYKSMGEVMANSCDTVGRDHVKVDGERAKTMDNHGQTVFPISNSMYILGAWGSLSSKGMDILGEEPLVLFRHEGSNRVAVDDRMFVLDPETGNFAPPKPVNDTFDLMGVPSWTRGVNRAHIGPLWGSPYGPGSNSGKQLSIGNPNGIKDSIIFVLTGDNSADLLSAN